MTRLRPIHQEKVILASEAPWRSDILKQLGIPHQCTNHRYDEPGYESGLLSEFVKQVAVEKARSLQEHYPSGIIIAADQLIGIGNEVLYKSGSEAGAIEQLKKLNGKSHSLFCAVAVLHAGEIKAEVDAATLTMRDLTSEEITCYVKKDKPWSCAGSYKIESLGASLFSSIRVNDPTTIIGIPAGRLLDILRSFGFSNLLEQIRT